MSLPKDKDHPPGHHWECVKSEREERRKGGEREERGRKEGREKRGRRDKAIEEGGGGEEEGEKQEERKERRDEERKERKGEERKGEKCEGGCICKFSNHTTFTHTCANTHVHI